MIIGKANNRVNTKTFKTSFSRKFISITFLGNSANVKMSAAIVYIGPFWFKMFVKPLYVYNEKYKIKLKYVKNANIQINKNIASSLSKIAPKDMTLVINNIEKMSSEVIK